MKPIKNIQKNIRLEKVFVYFKDLSAETLLITFLLSITLLILGGNILRVISNARINYEIFAIEAQGLKNLQLKNEQLQKELEYVSSDEYKMLLLRNSSNLAQSGEELYSLKAQAEYLDAEKNLLDVKTKQDFNDWWNLLAGFLLHL